MSRVTAEWIGKTDDAKAPPRVQLRTFLRFKGRCVACETMITRRRDWQLDHKVALINGGENRESNLQLLCTGCHRKKTRADVAAKAATSKTQKRHLGIKTTKCPMPGSRDSKWKKHMDGRVSRR